MSDPYQTPRKIEPIPAIVIGLLAAALVIVGGLNWGLVGVANFDLVAAIFGEGSWLSRLVYALVGLSALYQLAPFIRSFRVGEVAAEGDARRT